MKINLHREVCMKIEKKEKVALNFICLVVYKVFLDIIYTTWIHPLYNYHGFGYSFKEGSFLFSWIMVILFSVFSIKLLDRGKLVDKILIFLILLYFFPACTLCAFYNNDLIYLIFVSSYFFIMVCADFCLVVPIKIMHVRNKSRLFDYVLIFLTVIMILISGYYTGFRISFNLSEYYELRDEAKGYDMPALVSYMYSGISQVLPIGLTYAIVSKKKKLIILCSVAQILGFSFNGKKSVLFLLFLVLMVCWFYKEKYKDLIPIAFLGISVLAYAEGIMRHVNAFIAKHFIRRMMFIPAFLGGKYYDFFSENEYDYLRSSILRRFGFSSPYGESIPLIIGKYVYGNNSTTYANTGLCGDAYMNFGWNSLLIYPLLLVLTFKILEKSMEGMNDKLIIIVAFVMAYTFLSGSFFMNLLSNGVILLVFMMLICPRSEMR